MSKNTDTSTKPDGRRKKLEDMHRDGVNPYPHVSLPDRTPISHVGAAWEGHDNEPDTEWPYGYTIAGRLVAKRKGGKITFLDIRDWSGQMQAVCRYNPIPDKASNQIANPADQAMDLDVGDIISVRGNIYITPRNCEVALLAKEIRLLSKALKAPPDKFHGLKNAGARHRYREMDLIANEETREVFRNRARIIAAIREWLALKDFVEVETPTLQTLAGGANVRPFTTKHNALNRDLSLRVSVELFVNRCIVGGMDRVYDMGKVFRNEGISPKHSPEFTVIEWFMSYLDYKDISFETEAMIRFVAQRAIGRTTFQCRGETIDFAQPWHRTNMRSLLVNKLGIDIASPHLGEAGGGSWAQNVMELYQRIEPTLIQPTFVFDFPLEGFPITKQHAKLPHLGEHFDGVIGGIEIASGDTELNDPNEQWARFAKQSAERGEEHRPQPNDEEYTRALEYGYAPTAGVGMGIDRLVMILLEKETLREVIPFPIVKDFA